MKNALKKILVISFVVSICMSIVACTKKKVDNPVGSVHILAWELIAIIAYIFKEILQNNKIVFLIYALLSGFFFGIVVSLDTFFLYGFSAYLAYYLNGLLFDLMHAVGNVVFSGVLYVIYKHLERQGLFNDFIR